MDKNLFLKIVASMREADLEDFSYEYEGKNYGFCETGDDNNWEDEGKYQYKTESGMLIEMDKNYKELQRFNYGVSRSVQRSGSYFSDYYYDYDKYEAFEIVEDLIPEVIIPAHTEKKWNQLKITKKILDEIKLEEERKLELEKLEKQRVEEEKLKEEELKKKYSMNDYTIIQKVNKKLKKNGGGFTMKDMQKEYFNIVESEGLKDEEWLDYHRKNTLSI